MVYFGYAPRRGSLSPGVGIPSPSQIRGVRLLFPSFFSEFSCSEIVEKMQVIPLVQHGNGQDLTVENLGPVDNSNLLYAVDEFGNHLAIGVFVPQAHDNFQDVIQPDNGLEDKFKIPIKHEDDPNWVAAVEEIVTDSVAPDEKTDCSPTKDDTEIRVYRVNKGKKRNTDRKVNRKPFSRKKTLKEIKTKIISHRNKSKHPICRKEHDGNIRKMKKRRRCKTNDKAFPIPQSIRHVNYSSEFVYIFRFLFLYMAMAHMK